MDKEKITIRPTLTESAAKQNQDKILKSIKRQAIREFADWIKERIHGYETISNATDDCLCGDIDDHFNELYGEEV